MNDELKEKGEEEDDAGAEKKIREDGRWIPFWAQGLAVCTVGPGRSLKAHRQLTSGSLRFGENVFFKSFITWELIW